MNCYILITFIIENTRKAIAAAIDEDYRIKSLDSPCITNSVVGNYLIEAVDKYFNPSSDEELIKILQNLQEADLKTVEDFLDLLSPQEVGLEKTTPWQYLQLYLSDNTGVTKAFSEISGSDIILRNIKTSKEDEDDTSDEIYRDLYIKLSDMDVQKYIKPFKNEAFEKYRCRPAFPEPVVYPDEELEDTAVRLLTQLKEHSKLAAICDDAQNTLKATFNFLKKYSSSYLFRQLEGKSSSKSIILDEGFINEFLLDSLNLISLTSRDNSFEEITKFLGEFSNLFDDEDNKIDLQEAKKLYSGFKKSLIDYQKRSYTEQAFQNKKKEYITAIKESISHTVKANIIPKYQDDAQSQAEKIISLYRKAEKEEGGDEKYSEQITAEEDKFIGLFKDRHITKEPVTLLNECIKSLQNGSDVYEIQKNYLGKVLTVAEQTKIQYKLVQNQHEGASTKLRQILPLYYVEVDGEKKSLDSTEGMRYLIAKLRNDDDNHVILNLFLNQTGLSKEALNAWLDSFMIDNFKNNAKESHDLIITYLNDMALVRDLTQEFVEKNRMKHKSFKALCSSTAEFLERRTVHLDNSLVAHEYISKLKDVKISGTLGKISEDMYEELLQTVIDGISDSVSDSINNLIEHLKTFPEILEEETQILNIIQVPEDSEEYAKREEFYETCDKCLEEITNYISDVYDTIEEKGLGTEQQ